MASHSPQGQNSADTFKNWRRSTHGCSHTRTTALGRTGDDLVCLGLHGPKRRAISPSVTCRHCSTVICVSVRPPHLPFDRICGRTAPAKGGDSQQRSVCASLPHRVASVCRPPWGILRLSRPSCGATLLRRWTFLPLDKGGRVRLAGLRKGLERHGVGWRERRRNASGGAS